MKYTHWHILKIFFKIFQQKKKAWMYLMADLIFKLYVDVILKL